MDNEYELSDIFNKTVIDEKICEEGSFSLKPGIVGFFKRVFRMEESDLLQSRKR
jgi:hypothetical protein